MEETRNSFGAVEVAERIVDNRKTIKISRWKFILVLVLVFIGWFFIKGFFGDRLGSNSVNMSVPPNGYSQTADYARGVPSFSWDRFSNNGDTTIQDTREFLKTSYSANLKTRKVQKAVSDVKNIIKDEDGRVDSMNSSEKYGGISFVIPKSNLESFKIKVAALTNSKLYTETISSQNLLSQKQNIETQMAAATTSLEDLKKQKQILDSEHERTLVQLNNSYKDVNANIAKINKQLSGTNMDEITANSLELQKNSLESQSAYALTRINSENNNYLNSSNSLKSQISVAEQNLSQVNKQDANFADNIETVSGYVSVNWVSYWRLAVLLFPIHPTVIIIILVIISWFYMRKKKILPVVEFT